MGEEVGVAAGDKIYEIFSWRFKLYINQTRVNRVSRTGRLICSLEPDQGVKPESISQFNQTYYDCYERGNHLHMYRMFTTEPLLERDLWRFKVRVWRRCYVDLWGEPEWNILDS